MSKRKLSAACLALLSTVALVAGMGGSAALADDAVAPEGPATEETQTTAPDSEETTGSEVPDPEAMEPEIEAGAESDGPVAQEAEAAEEAPLVGQNPEPLSAQRQEAPEAASAAQCGSWESEGRYDSSGNSGFYSADPLALNSTICGYLGRSYDEDYFKVPTSAGTYRIDFKFDGPVASTDGFRLWLYDNNQNLTKSWRLTGTASNGAWIAKQLTRLPSGSAYIRIGTETQGALDKKYSVKLSKVSAAAIDTAPTAEGCLSESELREDTSGNSGFYSADPLALNSTICGYLGRSYDEDYFKVPTSAGTYKIDFKFDGPVTSTDGFRLWLYDNNRNLTKSWRLTGTASNGAWIAKQLTRLPSGSAYIRIGTETQGAVDKKYTVKLSKVSAAAIDTAPTTEGCLSESELREDTSGNSGFYSADPLALNSTICGYLGRSYDEDYFNVPTTASGIYRVKLTYANAFDPSETYYYTVTAYDGKQNPVKSWRLTAADWRGKNLDVRFPAGSAYVKVSTDAETYVGERYQLQVSLMKADTKPKPPTSKPSGGESVFTDVPKSHKFYSDIKWLSDAGITTGVKQSNGTVKFLPQDSVSREAMIAFLYRASGVKSYKPKGKSPFTDVKPGHKFYTQIMWAYETKVTTGTRQPNGTRKFLPKDSITREAMAAFMYRQYSKKIPNGKIAATFTDIPANHKFAKEIRWMASNKITTGTRQPNGTVRFDPKGATSREATAAFMHRAELKK